VALLSRLQASLLVGICEALVTANINCFGKFKRIFMIKTQKYVRKPLYVDVVRVTEENFEEVAQWCQGNIETEPKGPDERKFIRVRVHQPKFPRQTQAFVGDWLLYTEKGYKVYTNFAFQNSFDPVSSENASTDDSQSEQLIAHPELVAASDPTEVDPVDLGPGVEATLERPPETVIPKAVGGKRVLSVEEQASMNAEDIKRLLDSGEVILAQDFVAEEEAKSA
jgi:hypothetical protein